MSVQNVADHAGGTRVRLSIAVSKGLDARIRKISSAKNMPYREVVVQLLIAGLDTTQDLALAKVQPHA